MNAELLDVFGDDKMVVNAARVSYGKEVQEFGEKDVRLLKYLVKHKHTSPFRHPQLQFRICCPIFVERQLFKHQVGLTANSISGRYVDFEDSFQEPFPLRRQSKDSKQGSDGFLTTPVDSVLRGEMDDLVEKSHRLYQKLCAYGVAKEQARTILPLSLETQFIWTGSLSAFLHLFGLRLKPDAQLETRLLVHDMLDAVQRYPGQPFRFSLEAHGYE